MEFGKWNSLKDERLVDSLVPSAVINAMIDNYKIVSYQNFCQMIDNYLFENDGFSLIC